MEYAQGGIIKPHMVAPDSVPVWLLDGGCYLPARGAGRLGTNLLKRLNGTAPKEF
ncbi:hypothetical protein [Nocardia brasiliensis]|uniref:hypothetical protein n=1 Tax=Nocardia brasiliensis TaxID=37326 RepID=UPI000B0F4F8E|nr:hypothetical protein [Nocardia brasiliensis]